MASWDIREFSTCLLSLLLSISTSQTIVGEPVHRTSSAIGVYIPNSVKHLLNNIGLKPDLWF